MAISGEKLFYSYRVCQKVSKKGIRKQFCHIFSKKYFARHTNCKYVLNFLIKFNRVLVVSNKKGSDIGLDRGGNLPSFVYRYCFHSKESKAWTPNSIHLHDLAAVVQQIVRLEITSLKIPFSTAPPSKVPLSPMRMILSTISQTDVAISRQGNIEPDQ